MYMNVYTYVSNLIEHSKIKRLLKEYNIAEIFRNTSKSNKDIKLEERSTRDT